MACVSSDQLTRRSKFDLLEAELFEAVRTARTRLVAASTDERAQAIQNFKKTLDAFRRLILNHKMPREWMDGE